MRAFFLICLFSLLGIQARPLLEHGYTSMVESNYGTPAPKSVDKVLLRMIITYEQAPGLHLVQPSLATSYGRPLSAPPPPMPASPTHYHEASHGVEQAPGLHLVQPSLATSYGRPLSAPPPPMPASPTHYHEASHGVEQTPGLHLVQPSLATSYGRPLSPPPSPKPASPTHYHEARHGVYESPPNPFLASS
ncbi:unnamed protein product [Coffea canephora]|uniref:Extensin-like n=1 Tax=Coffea canephora TaxID=49390 RepID=A0A068TPU8_COFCA|nr:unnamed protein product [Coffea canephora]